MTSLTSEEIEKHLVEMDKAEKEFRQVMLPGTLIKIVQPSSSLVRQTVFCLGSTELEVEMTKEKKRRESKPSQRVDNWSWNETNTARGETKAIAYIPREGDCLLFLGYHVDPSTQVKIGKTKWETSDHVVPAWLYGSHTYTGWLWTNEFEILLRGPQQ